LFGTPDTLNEKFGTPDTLNENRGSDIVSISDIFLDIFYARTISEAWRSPDE
jgi:hypothetical protein